MKSNYKKIGDCIRLVDERNVNLDVTTLLGLSISKEFIPSVANIVGTDLKNYKIIRKNQFACSTMQVRRDKKMPVALLQDYDEAIISAAYPVFEVIDTEMILPKYLMMWFSRSEFDREACFYAIGGVRGSIEWEDFCNMELPIPSIEKQIKIVEKYEMLENEIDLNDIIIQKSEETAQTIFKRWFVDFEFPNVDGKPYKSSGGEMKFSEELDKEIPKEWTIKRLDELTEQICVGFVGSVFNYYCDELEGIPMLRTTDITEKGLSYKDLRFVTKEFHLKNKKSQLKKGDLLVARHGSNGLPVIFDKDFEANCLNAIIIKPDPQKMSSKLIHCFLTSRSALEHIQTSLGGSVQEVLNTQKIADLKLAYPKEPTSISFSFKYLDEIQKFIEHKRCLNQILEKLLEIILAKLSSRGEVT